jgi:hypothetical protein
MRTGKTYRPGPPTYFGRPRRGFAVVRAKVSASLPLIFLLASTLELSASAHGAMVTRPMADDNSISRPKLTT